MISGRSIDIEDEGSLIVSPTHNSYYFSLIVNTI
jgi:hypothetical protein